MLKWQWLCGLLGKIMKVQRWFLSCLHILSLGNSRLHLFNWLLIRRICSRHKFSTDKGQEQNSHFRSKSRLPSYLQKAVNVSSEKEPQVGLLPCLFQCMALPYTRELSRMPYASDMVGIHHNYHRIVFVATSLMWNMLSVVQVVDSHPSAVTKSGISQPAWWVKCVMQWAQSNAFSQSMGSSSPIPNLSKFQPKPELQEKRTREKKSLWWVSNIHSHQWYSQVQVGWEILPP